MAHLLDPAEPDDGEPMPPWQDELFATLLDAHARGETVITALPPQHPQRRPFNPATCALRASGDCEHPDCDCVDWR